MVEIQDFLLEFRFSTFILGSKHVANVQMFYQYYTYYFVKQLLFAQNSKVQDFISLIFKCMLSSEAVSKKTNHFFTILLLENLKMIHVQILKFSLLQPKRTKASYLLSYIGHNILYKCSHKFGFKLDNILQTLCKLLRTLRSVMLLGRLVLRFWD